MRRAVDRQVLLKRAEQLGKKSHREQTRPILVKVQQPALKKLKANTSIKRLNSLIQQNAPV